MDLSAIITQLGIDKMPADQQQRMFNYMFRTLQTRISLRLSQELTSDQLRSLQTASAQGHQAAQAELTRIYPQYAQMCQAELDQLRQDMQAL